MPVQINTTKIKGDRNMKAMARKYRQELHRIPEIGFELNKTRAYILEILKQHDCEITEVAGGICAFFRSESSAKSESEPDADIAKYGTIALRADMDALPVCEETGAAYASAHEGAMHACGHDGHMAMLLAVAGELDRIIHSLPHNVLLIFQPAEETTGGAAEICASGILAQYDVRRIYGFHLWPMLPKNTIGSRANEFMARSSELSITVLGKSTHCATADQGIDALSIGCELVCELYQMEKTELPAETYRLLKFGRMNSGTAGNVISAKTVIEGSVRCFYDETGDFLFRRIREITGALEEKYNCSFLFERTDGHPAVINDENLFEETTTLLSGYEFHTFEKPFMLAEDFSCYQKLVPGLFLFLGTGTGIPLHNSRFDFDEDVLETGVDIYLKLLQEIKL
jgi:hippurate hydrolase